MILGDFNDSGHRDAIPKELAEALRFAARYAEFSPGRHEFRGEEIFALVSDYRTRAHEEIRFENHERYVDIQCLASGAESILWAPIGSLAIDEPYDVSRDVAFHRPPATGCATTLVLYPGLFAIFFPGDAHAPGGLFGSASDVRKVVVKVAIKRESGVWASKPE